MAIRLNHTIVYADDKQRSATFLTELLGLPAPRPSGHFMAVTLADDVTLDYDETSVPFTSQHLAFLVSEEDFDRTYERIRTDELAFWADPGRSRPGEINTNRGGRGLYFNDPAGHLLEILTAAG